MTKKEFKEAMLRGLGRCVIAVQNEPEKYRNMVLWACKQDIAYDAQSEGTRAWYGAAMVSAYPDPEAFIGAAAEALKKHRSNGSWNFLHLCELLMLFAMDGSETAKQALEEKYQELLERMLARKRRPDRMFHELSDLEQLGLVLAADKSSFVRIARDFGRLYREKSYLEDGDFAWFFSAKGGQYRKTMKRTAEKDVFIACFLKENRPASPHGRNSGTRREKISGTICKEPACPGGCPDRQIRKRSNSMPPHIGTRPNRNNVQRL